MQALAALLRFGPSARIPFAPQSACQLEAQAVGHEACFRSGKNVHFRFESTSRPILASAFPGGSLVGVRNGPPPSLGLRPKPRSSTPKDSATEQMPKPPRLSQPRNEFGAPPPRAASVHRHAFALRTHAMRSNWSLQPTRNGMAPRPSGAGLRPFCAGRARRHAVACG